MEKGQSDTPLADERLVQEARAWFIKIHYGEHDETSQKAFENWLLAHKDHQKYYENICAFMQKTENYTSDPMCDERYKHLLSGDKENRVSSLANFIGFLKRTWKLWIPPGRFLSGSIVASLFLLLIASFISQNFIGDNSYQTAIGEQKTVTLADGSIVKLNTNTKITVDFSDLSRSVILDQGQAYFIVAKNPERPFIVNFNSGRVTAIGTEFEVYNKGPEVVVSLVEGSIKVQPDKTKAIAPQTEPDQIVMVVNDDLTTGTQISLSPEYVSPITKIDNKLINAWQKEQLIFSKASLKYVISEINRYSPRKVILAQSDMGSKIISGVFPIDSIEAISIISKYFGLTKSINDHGEIILGQASQLSQANQ